MPDVAVVITNYNTREHLRACLTSVFADHPSAVVVADNGSTDGSVEMVARDFPAAVLSVDPSNPGFGAAANRGIALTSTPHVLLLNSDTTIHRGALLALADYLARHPRAAIVGPRLANPDGSLQPSCRSFPTPLVTVIENSPARTLLRRLPMLREWYPETSSHKLARRVPWVNGAALAIRRRAFDAVHGFDESFFMYSEEIDLCYRLRRAGWETHFAPVTDVVHVGGASTRQYQSAMLAQLFLSSIEFYRRHHSGLRLAQAVLIIKLGMLGRLTRDGARWLATRDARRRDALRESLAAWRRVLLAPIRERHAA